MVSLADVYEALTGERIYKPVYSHEKAVSMIVNGECGQFNPSLLSCFLEEIDGLLRELKQPEMRIVRPPALNDAQGKAGGQPENISERTLRLLELERQNTACCQIYPEILPLIMTHKPIVLTFSEKYAEMFGGSFQLSDALHTIQKTDKILKESKKVIWKELRKLAPDHPVAKMEIQMETVSGNFEWFEVLINALWRNESRRNACR